MKFSLTFDKHLFWEKEKISVQNCFSKTMDLLKIVHIKIFFYFLNICESLKVDETPSIMCRAITELPQIHDFKEISTFDVIFQKNFESSDCLVSVITKNDLILTLTNSSKPFVITKKNLHQRKKKFVQLFVDSKDSLKVALESMTPDQYDYHGFYSIILSQQSIDDLYAMFDLLWTSLIYNVNILVQMNDSVNVFTFYPFARGSQCHDTEPVKINQFTNDTWKEKSFFPAKMQNFHRCKLKIVAYEYGPAAQRTLHPNGTITYNGSDIEILRGISDAINAELEINILTTIGSWGQIFENGSSSGAFEMVMNRSMDVCANFYYLTELRSKFMQFTNAYFSLTMMLMIPRGKPYSAFQKLLRPFKFNVWFILCASLLVGVLAVLFIKRKSRKIQLLFFDRNVNSPITEMLVILIGNSQHKLPTKSFSRILLMSFALFCFVFRAIYTGSLFKFLQVTNLF